MIQNRKTKGIFILLSAIVLLMSGLSACRTQTATPSESNAQTAAVSPETSGGKSLTCTVSVSCAAALKSNQLPENLRALLPKDGWIYPVKDVPFTQGETALAVLQRETKAAGIPLDVSGSAGSAYVKGIGSLYEKSCGDLSGWLYKVNGKIPSVGVSGCVLKEGDTVEMVFSCDMGKDMGFK